MTQENPFGVTYPVKSPTMRRMLMRQHQTCPECGGSIDVGYECTACGFDGNSEMFDAILKAAKAQAGI